MSISTARMITGPGTHDRSPPALSRTLINASSLVILCSLLATGQGLSLPDNSTLLHYVVPVNLSCCVPAHIPLDATFGPRQDL